MWNGLLRLRVEIMQGSGTSFVRGIKFLINNEFITDYEIYQYLTRQRVIIRRFFAFRWRKFELFIMQIVDIFKWKQFPSLYCLIYGAMGKVSN